MKANKKSISAEELDKSFESGKDISAHVDWELATKAVNVDLPVWAVKEMDKEATRRGVARQALIKMWLIDRLDSLREKAKIAS